MFRIWRNALAIIVAVFVFLLSGTFRAVELHAQSEDAMIKAAQLIHDGLRRNKDSILIFAKKMTFTQRLALYSVNEKSACGPFALNLLLSFGIGSWVQGNKAAGAVGTIGQLAGLAFILTSEGEGALKTAGYVLCGVSYIVNLIVPFMYSGKINSELKTALDLSGFVSIELGPRVNLSSLGTLIPGVGLSPGF